MKNDTFGLRILNVIWTYGLVFVPMWAVFAINNGLLNGMFNSWGIHPRDFDLTEFGSIMGSWLLHMDMNHIKGNSMVLLGILWIVALFERQIFLLMFWLIFASGAATWVLGAPHSVHFGASGLVFALFGYILSAATFGRKFLYLIPIFVLGGSYYYSLSEGLIPKDGVSFAAHFGGFIAGLIIGYYFNKKNEKQSNTYRPRRKTVKEWCKDKWWNLKYDLKRKLR